MSARARVLPILLLALAAPAAWADVALDGAQHIGDDENNSFEPRDPVTRTQMQAKPGNFHLSQGITVTAVRLDNPDDLDGRLRVLIDDMSTPLAGTLSGSTYTLSTPLTLAAGPHTLWADGGCSFGGFAVPCTGGENDFEFTAITLLSSQITFSRTLSRRTHLGDSADSDDDYGGRWYPDAADAATVSRTFTVEAGRMLSEIRFHRLRDVTPTPVSFARVLVDGLLVGTLTANADPFTIAPGTVLSAGSHTLTIEAGLASAVDRDDISWDDIVLVLINNPATTPGLFNAVDLGADAATGPITTKVAGTNFNLDIVAVMAGAQFVAYGGTVSVELVDAANAAGSCATWPALTSPVNAVFGGADNGRKTLPFNYSEAARDVRVRMTDAALALTSCSIDNFAIRPHTFGNLAVSHADSRSPGTAQALATSGFGGTTQPVHRAGQPFTLQATAYNAVGVVTTRYAGEPTVTATTSVLGAITGTASAGSWTYPSAGAVRSDAVTYSEAGAATLQLVDSSFAAVDSDDTLAGDRATTAAAINAGRFIPDHFAFTPVEEGEFAPFCNSFTYVGQPFQFTATGTPSARVIAMAADGVTPTRNYTDAALYRTALSCPTCASLPNSTYAAAPGTGTFDAAAVPVPDNSFINEGNGQSLFTLIAPNPALGYTFARTVPQMPFQADIAITLSLSDDDGVTFAASDPGRFGNAVAGEGIAFAGGGNAMRFGRLAIDNAHGSETLALPVNLRAEYYNNGFQTNADDSCSTGLVPGTTVTLSGLLAGSTNLTLPSSTAATGLWTGSLSPPGTSGEVTVNALLATMPWLRTEKNGDGDWLDNPEGLATFGISNDREQRIYQREVVGF